MWQHTVPEYIFSLGLCAELLGYWDSCNISPAARFLYYPRKAVSTHPPCSGVCGRGRTSHLAVVRRREEGSQALALGQTMIPLSEMETRKGA